MSKEDIPDWAADLANSILMAVKQKDPHTFYHCARVGRAARRLAKAMSLTEHEQSIIEYSGLFHDIGKVGVPDDVLLKPGKLTPEELKHMKSHPLQSAEMIEPLTHIPFFRFVLPGVRCHHERIDGRGYPFGLVGERIPMTARVIAIVDTVDAMTNSRPYRKALSLDVAKKELVEHSGAQFDAAMVKIYLDALRFWKTPNDESEDEIVVAEVLKKAA